MIETQSMMVLSTVHVPQWISEWLNNNPSALIVYPKADYGWFIWTKDISGKVPKELVPIINYAIANNYDWICLDRDAEIDESFEVYEWSI